MQLRVPHRQKRVYVLWLSVCPSVRYKPVFYQNGNNTVRQRRDYCKPCQMWFFRTICSSW